MIGRDLHRKYVPNDCFWDDIATEIQAYWLGFMTADGHATIRLGEDHRIELVLQARDAAHVYAFREALGTTNPIRHKPLHHIKSGGKVNPSVGIYITSSPLAWHLRLAKRELQLPAIPHPLLRHWLRGYWDGDGHIGAPPYRHVEVSGPRERLSSIRDYLVRELDVNVAVLPRPNGSIACLRYGSGRDAQAILEHMYSNASVALARKVATYKLATARLC